jgi:voltage-gated potassium channel Kch
MSAARSQLRPHDTTTWILVIGLSGLLVVLAADWLIATLLLHESPADGLHSATQVLATVGPGDATYDAPTWYLVFSSVTMLLTVGLTALFTAGVVNRLRSSRSVGLIGRRTLPTRDHVVVVGLGQVGLRLCTRLRELGIPVVAVERDPRATNLRLAKQAKVPVLIAHGEDRAVLRRLCLPRARALAAMGADELDNVEVAIAALAVCPDLRIVLRAGEDDVIAETRSLFHIGEVRDVSALTATAVTLSITSQPWETVYSLGHDIVAHPRHEPDTVQTAGRLNERCDCAR